MKYSSGYINTTNNFVISDIDTSSRISENEHSIFQVLKNILQRGTPSKLSIFLQEYYPKLESHFIPLVPKSVHDWQSVLCEKERDKCPVEEFYRAISKEKWFEEYSFVDRLLMPEVEINTIVPPSKDFIMQKVDFYLPQAKIVIEIEESSSKTAAQASYDEKRDKYLIKHGVKVYRLSAYQLKNRTESLQEFKQELTLLFRENPLLKEYLKQINAVDTHDIKKVEELTTIFRLQILLLELLDKGVLTLGDDWHLNFNTPLESMFQLALEDLLLWLKDIYILLHMEFQKPQVSITTSKGYLKDAINIDFDLYERIDQVIPSDWIQVRTDFREDLNHFKVATAKRLPYQLSEKNDTEKHALASLAKNILRMDYFEEFRHGQFEIIIHALNGNSTLGLMPTGGGKSLTYLLALYLQPAIGFVVEPVVSLMRDQVHNLHELGLNRIAEINSNMDLIPKDEVIQEYGEGKYQFVFVSPERFQTSKFRLQLKSIVAKQELEFAVIDEVHCLSEWSHDFRTSYVTLTPTIRELSKEITLLGLTATASSIVREDIMRELGIKRKDVKRTFIFHRKELDFHVYPTPHSSMEKEKRLLEELKSIYPAGMPLKDKVQIAGIVFANRDNSFFNELGVYDLAKRIQQELDIDAQAYTTTKEKGVMLSDQEFNESKMLIQDRFKNNKFPLIVATKPFGMGIDKRNIRYTVHYDLPLSLEQLYQEAGRAGRDGNHADAIVYFEETPIQESVMERLFHPATGVDEVNTIRASLKGSLSNMLFFSYSNLVNIEQETELMYFTFQSLKQDGYQFLSSSKTIHDSKLNFPIQNFEHILYRLSILGVVKDWTVENWYDAGGRSYTVLTNPFHQESINKALLKYIHTYDPSFKYDESDERYNAYYKYWSTSNKPVIWKFMYLLNLWNYDNFVYTRRQSIKNVYEACLNYKPTIDGKSQFKQHLEQYFAFTDSASVLEEISYEQDNIDLWIKVYTSNKGILQLFERAPEIDASIKSLIEAHRYHTGLNFVSGFTKLILNEWNAVDGKERMKLALENIKKFDLPKQNQVFERIEKLVVELNSEQISLFTSLVLEQFPERSEQMYNTYHDPVSLELYLEQKLSHLKLLKENITW